MSSPVPTFKVLPVETPVAGTIFENYDFVKKCATEYSQKPKGEDLPNLVNALIFQLEEEEIVALKDPANPSYQTLQATLQPIMDALQCNIIVIVGHNTACFTYIDTQGIPIVNTLPTIVLLVACFSDSKIAHYNTMPDIVRNNIYFFGFRNYMHLLQGEILACKSHHLAAPFLDCRFEEVKQDLDVIQANATQYTKPYAEQVDLLKCCRGRYEHFKQVFYDYLSNRECVKFTTANLLDKLKAIRAPDGSLVRNASMVDGTLRMSIDQLETYIFKRSEGTPCTAEGNCSTGKTSYANYKPNLTKFDDRVKFGNSLTKQLFEILNYTNRYTPEEHIQKDKEMADLLKGVPKTTALASLMHSAIYRSEFIYISRRSIQIPLFFYIFAENYKLSTQEILKNHAVPLDTVIENGYYTLVTVILEHMVRTETRRTLTEKEVYRLLKAIGQKNLHALEVSIPTKQVLDLLFISRKCYLSLIELLFRYFPTAIPKENGYVIWVWSKRVEEKLWTIQEASRVFELFCGFHNFKTIESGKTIGYIANFEAEITGRTYGRAGTQGTYKMPLEFLLLLHIYLHDETVYPEFSLTNRIRYWTEQHASAKAYMKPKLNRMIKVYEEAKKFFEKMGSSDMASYRKTPEQLQALLDVDLAPMETTTGAIEEVVSYMKTVQPAIQKRSNLNTATKSAAVQQLVALYKGANLTKNEGENALNRLTKMHSFYTGFLRNHPRANKPLPNVVALRTLPEPSQPWFYKTVAMYLAGLKATPAAKTARRGRPAKVINLNALRSELGNITTRLAGHNSGTAKLHHMTVKSLRKKKNAIQAQLNALTPAPVAAAGNAGNNTEPENNQGGGRRRTRKLRR